MSTSTTGFVGPTLTGPSGGTPELLTSFADFERIYGGLDPLSYGTNYLAHSVRAYFNEGGSRLYVSRVVTTAADAGFASAAIGASGHKFVARFPGRGGNGTITVSAMQRPASPIALDRAPSGSVFVTDDNTPATHLKGASGWTPALPTTPTGNLVTLSIRTRDGAGREVTYEDVGLDPQHPRWIGNVLSRTPTRQSEALQRQFAIDFSGATPPTGTELKTTLGALPQTFTLTGGLDGDAPTTAQYEAALEALAGIEDISIVAAPGSSSYGTTTGPGVRNALISHAEKRRAYRVAVLDTPAGQSLGQVREWRGQIDSKYAALYYPWVVVANPLARAGDESIPKELALPPSGFLCGIYARNDVQRGVFKAPANEVVNSALRFESDVNFAQQEVLNPLGINCLRFFPGRGYRVWGARTASSDPEWKYLNIRRYFNFLERSIDVGTQWAVFEPNGERLWANIRETIGSFLETQWRSGALLGTDPKQAFFVRCDRSTMTQDDLDNGRLICLVGVAAVKPAEFVIFRIGQKTADARS
ncbi:phage tail sheath subtilisin-like domain-containing protein [Myxococcus stipitatus]|uniref:phage tail sheath family protein n=1 Tax=Myxococcus stipitatus TaxID=83455 RepID=UPI001F2D0311|nr:phage tail sheath subtilisin-like domain-containing protein [Myxococcus stipitatus]MCE9670509.1 phage tail sheath subtilisin-like domain-containing protein [Myxococcus stipitatus]